MIPLQIEGVGIKKQFASTIAGALLDLAEARPELLGEGGGSGGGSGGGEERMVTLAVEGNISAGEGGSGHVAPKNTNTCC